MIKNILSVSGGKDSTAMLLLALERETENLQAIFCDTGHEHPSTYDYLDYLEKSTGVEIKRLKHDFSEKIAKRRDYITNHWPEKLVKEGMTESAAEQLIKDALSVLHPTGIPFLDLCLWKGRFPSSRARFCTQWLKREPADAFMQSQLEGAQAVISWQGIRNDESFNRRELGMYDVEFGQWEPEPQGHLIYRPIHAWTAQATFEQHKKHGVKWNPLYEKGFLRVGCMPCINCRKSELANIGNRFRDELERVAEWERIVAKASKRGSATMFASSIDPLHGKTDNEKVSLAQHGIIAMVEWANTTHGGRQYDLLSPGFDDDDTVCDSAYGLCE